MDDGGFSDPAVRCLTCGQILLMTTIKKMGCCHKCGHKRITDVRTMDGEEMAKLKEKRVSEKWLAEFEEVKNVDIIE